MNKPFNNLIYILLTILTLTMIAISAVLIQYSVKFYQEEKSEELMRVSDIYVNDIQSAYAQSRSFKNQEMQRLNYNFNNSYDMSFFIYDPEGNVVLSAESSKYNKIPNSLKEFLDESFYLDYETDEISDSLPSICYGKRFHVSYQDIEPQTYYLMSYASSESINSFTMKLTLVFIILFIILLLIGILIFKLIVAKLSKPIKAIERVTGKYAKGDFSEKLSNAKVKEYREIYDSINEMADFIETNEQASKNFIANVSHELRTPITTIGGFVDGILDGTIDKKNEVEYLSRTSVEIKRLKKLITSMLNMSKFEAGTMKPNFSSTNLTEIVIKTVFMFEKKLYDKNIDIQGLDADKIIAVIDKNLIEQVIYNLIENAVKFVNQDGVISFSFVEGKETVSLSVRNTGEGLADNEISKVFTRFYKADESRGKDSTGLGLGLAISRKIIQLHHGEIIAKSIFGEYTEFTIQLPYKQG